MTGCVVSGGGGIGFTVTVKDALLKLPAASLALQFTRVSPSGNSEPEDGLQAIVRSPPPTLSSCVIVVPSSSNVAVPSTLSCVLLL
jgi:hypothetical protein